MAFSRDNDDYKASKEAFVSNTTGSTVFHVNLISLVALASIALHSAIRSRFPPPPFLRFISEWVLFVIPLLLSITLFADRPGTLSATLLLPTALPSQQGLALGGPETGRLSALSTYRAHMMLVTVLSILAVDFPVFPRALAKCETYGVSFMDMGVGAFVFSQGVVSAIPVIQSVKYPAHLRPPLRVEILSVLRKSLPVLVLGLVRVALVKGTQYPEHVTEYGVHWNFFLTLAMIPVLRVFLLPLVASMPISFLGLLVASAHQLSLSAGLTSYVLNAPRQTLISANKEGLVSLVGYLAIHLLGLSTGTLIIPHSPSYYRRQQAAMRKRRDSGPSVHTHSATNSIQHRLSLSIHREDDKTATVLFSYAVIYWTLFGICRYLHIGGPDASRRLVNLPYIAWVAAYNTTFLLCYFLLDLAFFPTPLAKSTYSPVSGLKVVRRPNDSNDDSDAASTLDSVPPQSTPINRNSLATFLVANVATGVVNLSMRTMYASDGRAMCVLGVYTFGVCAFAWVVRGRRILKL
ncbi:GWT1-domain-containing protein [Russula brevipes]|nr:GWT1-domain-containing protein [Russula brevipes]